MKQRLTVDQERTIYDMERRRHLELVGVSYREHLTNKRLYNKIRETNGPGIDFRVTVRA